MPVRRISDLRQTPPSKALLLPSRAKCPYGLGTIRSVREALAKNAGRKRKGGWGREKGGGRKKGVDREEDSIKKLFELL
jgi:hypothetical protein